MSADEKTPGLAILMAGKSKDGAKGEHTDKAEDEPEDLDEALKDAHDAHRDAHGVGDLEAMAKHSYTIHKLNAAKMRKEED